VKFSILYRGPLSSCNYGCVYCPFAKHQETAEEHERDRQALQRFLDWVAGRTGDRISVFFTPWGEAMVRRRYQQALIQLTNQPHVEKVAVQTNLSCRLDWIERCDPAKVGLWATYHPSQIDRATFLTRCLEADRRGARLSVGVVGLKEQAEEIEALRRALPSHIYLWINAYKRDPSYYGAEEIERFTAMDPLFPLNNTRHPSKGRACRAGQSVIAVDGEGTIRRCHFIREPIGNIYEPGIEFALRERVCTNDTCGCHIGYVHLDHLGLYDTFGEGVLERIPARAIW
jgi:MoaA/NifB/PqqE/SkfB family radical SAM enzyme